MTSTLLPKVRVSQTRYAVRAAQQSRIRPTLPQTSLSVRQHPAFFYPSQARTLGQRNHSDEFIYPFVHRSLGILYGSKYLVVFRLVTVGALKHLCSSSNTPTPISSFARERRGTAARLLGFFPVGKAPLRAAGKLAKPLNVASGRCRTW